MHLSVEHVIAAPADALFALTLDVQRFPQLFTGCGPVPGLRCIEHNSPPGIGATRRVESMDGACMIETITFLDPPRRHAYRLSGLRPPLAWLARVGHANWTFSEEATGTRVRWTYDWEPASVFTRPLAWLLLKVFMRTAMTRCLRAMAQSARPVGEAA
ncbi:SRPBCC family protein [Pseudomarimonas arenosa]|uniref:SRPBCC family protein n=1 Tax=Pseudomarimonas arenosa TaxID=2774145 RepID=A0AAW3ZPD9_9GAMM|nr:SRPBCC family protein [Pseudomarimonas arenosa]MBD8527818.1 SRPBCC family protein [Pseudomarimonas arenosa]